MIHPVPAVSRRALLGAGVAMPVALLAACGGEAEPVPGPSGPVEPVTYLTSFRRLGRDAYADLALREGLFSAAGYDVTIEGGDGAVQGMAGLISGRVHWVAADLAAVAIIHGGDYDGDDEDVREELGGRPITGVVCVAAIHQRAPLAVWAYQDSGIRNVYDLSGRSLGVPPGASGSLLMPAYLEAAGVDPAEVEQVPMEPGVLVPALASGQVDAITQFIMGRPLVEAPDSGRPLTVLPVDEFLPDLYGVGLWTTQANAEANPVACARFRDAVLTGLDMSLNDPQAAAQALAELEQETDPEIAAAELVAMAPYSRPTDPGVPLGHIDRSRLARHIATLTSAGLRTTPLEPDTLADFSLVPGAE